MGAAVSVFSSHCEVAALITERMGLPAKFGTIFASFVGAGTATAFPPVYPARTAPGRR